MRTLLLLWRSLRVFVILVLGIAIASYIVVRSALNIPSSWTPAVSRWWFSQLCYGLGLRIDTRGALAPGALIVSNHISWLDIPVLGSLGEVAFLSKAEVRDWPLIGWLAQAAGTLFIERGGHRAQDIVDHIAERVSNGGRVVVFPEGTTTDGTAVKRFHPRLFAAAQTEGAIVQPVALRYGRGQADRIAPFIGDDSLVPHLLRVLYHPRLDVSVEPLAPLDASELDRRRLSERCRDAIASALEAIDDGLTTAERPASTESPLGNPT